MTAHMRSLHLRPLGIVGGAAAAAALESGAGRRLAGGRLVYTACGVFLISKGEDGKRQLETSRVLPLAETIAWADREGNDTATAVHDWLKRVSVSPPPFAGLALDCPAGSLPLIMGIVNVTPDSFSDGGDHADPESAIAHGMEMWQAGADILDVGGESTRPGADPVAVKEELERITPVVRGLAEHGARVSIDTRHATVMAAALETGAQIINDVSALTGDPESLSMAAKSGAPVILMHMQGDPKTMQDDPRYGFAPTEIYEYLSARIEACVAAGIDAANILVDPGVGFGKTFDHNVDILDCLSLFHGLGRGILVGVSRKRFIASLSREEAPKDRLPGSLAAALAAVDQGVQMLRVHDVAETRQALSVWDALNPVGE